MSKTAFITGIAGQDGAYLADFLLRKRYRVIGLGRDITKRHLWRLDYFGIRKSVRVYQGSILDMRVMKKILLTHQPKEIYNFAGQTSAVQSWESSKETLEANGAAVLELLKLMAEVSPKSRLFQAGSREMYGAFPGVITEKTDRFAPLNPYGIGKLAAHFAVRLARDRHGLFAVNGILFNHESPLRPDTIVTKKIARGVARIARGIDAHIELGNLDARRNWSFAGDAVEAMWRMLQEKRPSDFVICAAESHSITDFVRAAFAHVGMREWKKYVRVNPAFVRAHDVQNARGSSERARVLLGWKPKVDFFSLVSMMVDYELEHLEHAKTS